MSSEDWVVLIQDENSNMMSRELSTRQLAPSETTSSSLPSSRASDEDLAYQILGSTLEAPIPTKPTKLAKKEVANAYEGGEHNTNRLVPHIQRHASTYQVVFIGCMVLHVLVVFIVWVRSKKQQ